jgi:hypothetical protein
MGRVGGVGGGALFGALNLSFILKLISLFSQ